MKTFVIKKYQTSFFQCIDCLMIVLGTVGVVGGLVHSLYFPPQSIFAVGLLSLLGIILYFHFDKGISWIRHNLLGCFILLSFILVLLFFSSIQGVIDQLLTIIEHDYFLEFNTLFQNVNELNGILPIIFVFLLGIPIIYLIISLICEQHRSLLKICILLLLFFFPVFISHSLERYTSYCFILFILYQFVFSWILQYQKGQLMLRGLLIVVLSIALFFSSVFLEPNPLFNQSSSSVLTQINNWIDAGAFHSLFNHQNVTGTSTNVDGSLPTNSVQTNQGIAMTVKASTPFSSYVRGYSLGYYENNQWHSVENSPEQTTSLIDYTNYLKSSEVYKVQSVEIETTQNTEYQFVPYFPSFQREIIDDSYYQKFTGAMDILISDSMQSNFINSSYRQYSYEDYVRQEYLKIPAELEDDLRIFLEEHSVVVPYAPNGELLADCRDNVKQVKEAIFKETKYDLNAGALPANTDFLRYFLFENHRGSCTHFSTAGALLLRCLGIPTRYVRGYILKESDFENGVATIRNYRSHAWIEVYESGKGWVPYEMTPTDGESNLNEVGTMLDRLVNNNTQQSSSQTNPNTPKEEPSTTTTTSNQGEQKSSETIPWYQNFLKYQNTILTICIILICILSYRFITRSWLSIRLRQFDNNKKIILYYYRVMKIMKFGGTVDDTLISMANKAQFSQHLIRDDEVDEVKQIYQLFINEVYHQLPFYKKIIFKYIYGYK